MKRGVIWIVLTCLMVTSLVLASCATSTTSTSTPTPTTNLLLTHTATTTTTKTATTNYDTTDNHTTATGNWWDKLGTPQYGGTMTIRVASEHCEF